MEHTSGTNTSRTIHAIFVPPRRGTNIPSAYVHRLTRRPPRFRDASSERETKSGMALTNKEYAESMLSNSSDSMLADCINRRAVNRATKIVKASLVELPLVEYFQLPL